MLILQKDALQTLTSR